jgi:hypothetical protein
MPTPNSFDEGGLPIWSRKTQEFGYEEDGIGRTGVAGRLRPEFAALIISGRIWMRCRSETTNLPYRSRHEGACTRAAMTVMQRCCSAPRYLAESRNFDGTVHPDSSPRKGLGSGEAMVKTGCSTVSRATQSLAQPAGLAVGKFPIRTGPMMAGGAYFDITVTDAARMTRARTGDRSGDHREPHHDYPADHRVAQCQAARHGGPQSPRSTPARLTT